MPGELQPLAQNFKIVDENGFPTLYFIKWAQERQIDIGASIDADQALEIATDYVLNYLLAHKLQEGSGIQITPDGNISNSPLITADAQEILDQISATRGVILYRGLLGWAALTPGTAGYVLQSAGAGADPLWAAGGGGGGSGNWINPEIAPPLAAWFATQANTPVLTDYTDYAMGLTGAAGSTTVRYAVKAGLAANASIVLRIKPNLIDNNTFAGFVARDSAGGRLITYGPCFRASDMYLNSLTWSAPNAVVADVANAVIRCQDIWLKIDYVFATKVFTFSFSYDGKVFKTHSTSSYVTSPNQFGVAVWSTTTGGFGGVPSALITYWTDGTNNGTPLSLIKT